MLTIVVALGSAVAFQYCYVDNVNFKNKNPMSFLFVNNCCTNMLSSFILVIFFFTKVCNN